MTDPPEDREQRWDWLVEQIEGLNRRIIRLEALDVGGRRFGALGDDLRALDAKIEGFRKRTEEAETALQRMRDEAAEKQREAAKKDGERAAG